MDHCFTFHAQSVVSQDLLLKKNYRNLHQIPKLDRIVLNTGTKSVLDDKKNLIPNLLTNELFSGQKATQIQAKRAVASFYLQKGNWVGWRTTLRCEFMRAFLSTLVIKVLPSTEAFQGFQRTNLDREGNLQFGLTNPLLFSEIDFHFEPFQFTQGMNITISSTAATRSEAKMLFSAFQLPFEAN